MLAFSAHLTVFMLRFGGCIISFNLQNCFHNMFSGMTNCGWLENLINYLVFNEAHLKDSESSKKRIIKYPILKIF